MGYALLVLAGALLCNAIPHLTAGVRGERFPTPFARPPGVGLSEPLVNVLWGSGNLFLGMLFARRLVYADVRHGLVAVAAGFLVTAVALAWHFGRVRNR